MRIASLSGPDPVAVAGADLVVAVGAAAARAAATGNDAPVLAALISQQEATTLRTQAGNRRLGAIVLDQPMLRTLRLTRLVAPVPAARWPSSGPKTRRRNHSSG